MENINDKLKRWKEMDPLKQSDIFEKDQINQYFSYFYLFIKNIYIYTCLFTNNIC